MNLPFGTVTFRLTDIEGSPKLAQKYHDMIHVYCRGTRTIEL
jgi:hypothetical protein